jgi:hypothetical protein
MPWTSQPPSARSSTPNATAVIKTPTFMSTRLRSNSKSSRVRQPTCTV